VTKLKIGRFFYSNLFPIYYMLEKEADCSSYEFVEGVPSYLNREIREGRIDVSPSSSIEYLKNTDRYDLIEGHSISSMGPVGSVSSLLLSPKRRSRFFKSY
jgi:chorismate dehydratase